MFMYTQTKVNHAGTFISYHSQVILGLLYILDII